MRVYFVTFLLLYVHCSYIGADVLNNVMKNTLSVYMRDGNDLYPDLKICSTILDAFSDYAANFTKCSIKHARPVRMCEKCIDHYVNFHMKYQELITTSVNGTSCISVYVSHDRLNVVTAYHDSILAMWDKGNCNECFTWVENKRPEISNGTKTFNKMFNGTMDCIIKNMNENPSDTDQVCQRCMLNYVQLDEYYKSLSDDSIGVDSVCMDIVDSMNATRIIWSQGLNCCKLRRTPEIIFLCSTAIISVLPLLFYLAVRYCGPIKDLPSVLKQSRFKQSIMRTMDRTRSVN